MIKVGILVISDKGSKGERRDESGPTIRRMISKLSGYQAIRYEIVPDEKEIIGKKLKECVDKYNIDLILTSGGTGIGPRDVTP